MAHVSSANNSTLSQWRIIRLNHNPSIIGLLLKIYLRLIFLTFWLPLIRLSTERLINEAVPNACTQTAIRFFTAKYEILQLYPNGHSFFLTAIYEILQLSPNGHSFFFYREIRNFTVTPKRSFVFLQRNAKFWKLYQNGHSFFTAK